MPTTTKKPTFDPRALWTVGLIIAIVIVIMVTSHGAPKSASPSTTSSSTAQTTDNTPAPKPDTTPGIGQQASDGKFQFTVTNIQCGQTQLGNDNQFETATAQGQFCTLALTMQNTGNVSQDFESSSQYLYDSSGKQYSADNTGTMAANPSGSQCYYAQVNPGVSLSCVVAFDISKTVTPVYAVLHDSSLSGGVRVNLK